MNANFLCNSTTYYAIKRLSQVISRITCRTVPLVCPKNILPNWPINLIQSSSFHPFPQVVELRYLFTWKFLSRRFGVNSINKEQMVMSLATCNAIDSEPVMTRKFAHKKFN